MRTINMFGRKMPVLAILMAALIVGTASAAVYSHYATLEGTVEIGSPITVTPCDEGGNPILDEGENPIIIGYGDDIYYELIVEDIMAPDTIDIDLIINNAHDDNVTIKIQTTVYDPELGWPSRASGDPNDVFYWSNGSLVTAIGLDEGEGDGETLYTSSTFIPSYVIGTHVVRIEVMPTDEVAE